MAYFLFLDESGSDRRESPSEVLAGIAIRDLDLWNFIRALGRLEMRIFGTRYSQGKRELKARKILKRKTFKLAGQLPQLPDNEMREYARRCILDGENAGHKELTALAQAKLQFVHEALRLSDVHCCKVFASIVPRNAPRGDGDFLRKDYAYLFQRFYYYLQDLGSLVAGCIVFDELEKSKCHVLIDQLSQYFKVTLRGKQRAEQIIPEPFFVHSELTTGVQIAYLVSYILSWGYRTDKSYKTRSELHPYVEKVVSLRYVTT